MTWSSAVGGSGALLPCRLRLDAAVQAQGQCHRQAQVKATHPLVAWQSTPLPAHTPALLPGLHCRRQTLHRARRRATRQLPTRQLPLGRKLPVTGGSRAALVPCTRACPAQAIWQRIGISVCQLGWAGLLPPPGALPSECPAPPPQPTRCVFMRARPGGPHCFANWKSHSLTIGRSSPSSSVLSSCRGVVTGVGQA